MNALHPPANLELHEIWNEFERVPDVWVGILTGAGDKAFSAGNDLRYTAEHGRDMIRFAETGFGGLANRTSCWKPIIAAVNGWAMGGGFWYQLAADITIASDQAVFAQPEVRHISNTTFLLGALCGWKAANRWGLTGDHFDAQEALRIGMVNEVVPHDQLMDATRALAKRIALVPEPSVRLNKSITMLGMQAAGVYSGLLLEGALGALAHSSHNEFREKLFETQREHGLKAYLDMRDGPFQPEPMGPRSAKGRQKKAGP
jgi:enoyl-CoA hydratase/carnithine racemase